MGPFDHLCRLVYQSRCAGLGIRGSHPAKIVYSVCFDLVVRLVVFNHPKAKHETAWRPLKLLFCQGLHKNLSIFRRVHSIRARLLNLESWLLILELSIENQT
jgi:hypothetical protein